MTSPPAALVYEGEVSGLAVTELPKLLLPGLEGQAPLQLRAHLPEGEGPFPVILFSHGAWGTNDEYLELMQFWASHGYVTLQPNHHDSRALGVKVGDRQATRGAEKRPGELRRLLDGLEDPSGWAPELMGRLDLERLGVAGHSAGAATALQLAGATVFVADRPLDFAHTRVRAVAALAAPAVGGTLREASFAELDLPVLAVVGSLDAPNRGERDPKRRRAAFDLSPAGDKVLLWVEGMDHGLGGIQNPATSTQETHLSQRRLVALTTLAFWDATLQDSKRARRYLASGALARLSGGLATIEQR